MCSSAFRSPGWPTVRTGAISWRLSLIIWSAFTVLCGRSRNYLEFLLGRIGVGVGEAGGTPPSTAIVSDYFPADRRPMAMTVLALGAPIGAWSGLPTWRAGRACVHLAHAAFIALGVPGLVVGVMVYLTVREPRGAAWTPSSMRSSRRSGSR
jgi:MFS family permease